MPDDTDNYVRANYDAFKALLPTLPESQNGKFALMRDGGITAFFDTARDAYVAGQNLYKDGRFSVQEVTGAIVDLGFFSHAVPQQ